MSDEYTAHTEDDGSVVFGEGYTPRNAKPEPVKADHWWEKVLTIEVRKAIYTAMAAIGGVLVMIGLVTAEQWQGITDSTDSLLGLMIVVSNMVALFHVPGKE